jgi:phosphate transport system substrate-binding protein
MRQKDVSSIIFFFRSGSKKRVSNWTSPYISAIAFIIPVFIFLLLGGCGDAERGSDLQGHLLIVGGSTVQPFVQSAISLFQQQDPSTHIDIQGSGSVIGLQAVANKKADIGMSSIYADPSTYPSETDHLVGVLPGIIVVGPSISISSLTLDQILAIFSTRTIGNWQDLGGPNLPITPVMRDDTSGLRVLFDKYVLQGHTEDGTVLPVTSDTAMRDFIARTPGAIGYIGLPNLTSTVHEVAINGLTPTLETINQQKYPFWGYVHMYTSDPDSALRTAFLSFLLSTSVQKKAYGLGYLPTSAGNFEGS